MGDRVSIQFKNGDEKSVVLFHHWGGSEFPDEALDYAKTLAAEMREKKTKQGYGDPYTRLEPRVVIVDFIRHLIVNGHAKDGRVTYSLYLGVDQNDGDNSDNGHHVIDLKSLADES